MIPFNKPKIWLSLFAVIIILFIVSDIIDRKQLEHKHGHYKEIGRDTIINSIVVDFEKGSRGFLFITLKNNRYYWIDRARNLNYNPSDLCDLIKVGDSISKAPNTDTFYTYKDSQVYEFKLGDEIRL